MTVQDIWDKNGDLALFPGTSGGGYQLHVVYMLLQCAFFRACRAVNFWLPSGVMTYWSIGPRRRLPGSSPFLFQSNVEGQMVIDAAYLWLWCCAPRLLSGAWGGWDCFEWMMNLQLNVSRVDRAEFCVQLHAVLTGRMRIAGAVLKQKTWQCTNRHEVSWQCARIHSNVT